MSTSRTGISNGALRYLRAAAIGKTPPCRVQRAPPSPSLSRHPTTAIGRGLLRKYSTQPADQPGWVSLVDKPQQMVRVARQRHGPGLIILALIPIIAFGLGTWQVQRLGWKMDLIARFEDRLVREPLPLPPTIDPNVIHEFDYRRVYTMGKLRHDQEILVGPRIHDGEDGFQVITPLERGEDGSKILIGRGWIAKKLVNQADRPEGVPQGEVMVKGLLREPYKKNRFTPSNDPENGKFYFPDIQQIAELTGSQAVFIEETTVPSLVEVLERETKGIPIGRLPEVNLRNNHTQYIFTWYGLAFATSIMFWMVVRKPPSSIMARARHERKL